MSYIILYVSVYKLQYVKLIFLLRKLYFIKLYFNVFA